MTVLVTGAAGFIGFHLCRALLERGDSVVGIDSLNDSYDPALKRMRLSDLREREGFRFAQIDVSDADAMAALPRRMGPFRAVLHMAARAGVRDALRQPFAYGRANLMGQLTVLEMCRRAEGLEHLVYASSSSVYGDGGGAPSEETDRADAPVSLYAATKRAGELMASAHARLHGVPATGLRFFTVYGPWGRPDMAPFLFADALMSGRPIRLFNGGNMKRDFTFIDDIVGGTLAVLARPPGGGGTARHRVFNIGSGRPAPLRRFVSLLERALGREAAVELLPMQPGDVVETSAGTAALEHATGFRAYLTIDEGVPRFAEWYMRFRAGR